MVYIHLLFISCLPFYILNIIPRIGVADASILLNVGTSCINVAMLFISNNLSYVIDNLNNCQEHCVNINLSFNIHERQCCCRK